MAVAEIFLRKILETAKSHWKGVSFLEGITWERKTHMSPHVGLCLLGSCFWELRSWFQENERV